MVGIASYRYVLFPPFKRINNSSPQAYCSNTIPLIDTSLQPMEKIDEP